MADEKREPEETTEPDERTESLRLRDDEPADVDVSTSVRARSLRFGIVPETRVWFEGDPAERSNSETERRNLPDEVEPGVEYRDVEVRWRARSRIVHPTDPDQAA